MISMPEGVAFTTDPGGRAAVRLRGPGGSTEVALTGAQVLLWRASDTDVLWTASKAEYAPNKPVRGGIPLVFPWFGDHGTDPKLPAHGFARTLQWRLIAARPGPAAQFAVAADEQTRTLWPHDFRLTLTVSLEHTLRLTLAIENPGEQPFRCESAMHTYLSVGDIHTATVHGLEGLPCVEQAQTPEADWDRLAPLRFRAETDRIFQDTGPRLELRAPALGRTVELTSDARSTVVWNPWSAKGARLSQLTADDWRRFCCIESANVREHAIVLAPGQRHTTQLAVHCR
jgi:glucose-6-phosphate 1-epimerase